jgi:hypothetical protein
MPTDTRKLLEYVVKAPPPPPPNILILPRIVRAFAVSRYVCLPVISLRYPQIVVRREGGI